MSKSLPPRSHKSPASGKYRPDSVDWGHWHKGWKVNAFVTTGTALPLGAASSLVPESTHPFSAAAGIFIDLDSL